MSIRDFMRNFIVVGDPAPSKQMCAQRVALTKLVDDFREVRSDEVAKLLQEKGMYAGLLTQSDCKAERWQEYARKLEKLCLKHGLDAEMPRAPDE